MKWGQVTRVPERIGAIEDQLREQGSMLRMVQQEKVPLVLQSDLALAHDLNYILTLDDFLRQLEETGDTRALDPTHGPAWNRSAVWRSARGGRGGHRCRDRRASG